MTRAEVKENLLVALDTLRSRKVRSGLTILGIVIGVTSVISVAAIIDGLNGYIEGRIRNLGSQALFVTRIPPGYTGISRLPADIRARKYLQFDDGRYLAGNGSIAGLRHRLRPTHQPGRSRLTKSATAISTSSA